MVPLAGRPILEHVIRRLAAHGVDELVMNLYHRPEAIRSYFGDGSAFGVRIHYSLEQTLLGTAGALRPWIDFFDAPFFLVYGDNLSTCDFSALGASHRSHDAFVTVALHWREDLEQSGVAELDDDGRITRFLEKPASGQTNSHWVNAGILVLEPRSLQGIPQGRYSDFGRELLPEWIARGHRVYGYQMTGAERLWWIDRPEDLLRAQGELATEKLR